MTRRDAAETPEDWATSALRRLGRTVVTPFEQVRARAWSTVCRAGTAQGAIWLKTCAPGTAHEAGLYLVLARHAPGSVLRPLAVDGDRGWLLLPDGGPSLREVAGAAADLETWERLLGQYADLQRALEGSVTEMLAAGTPRRGPTDLPTVREDLLADAGLMMLGHADGLSVDQRRHLVAAAPAYAADCSQLESLGIPLTVQHDDLHDNNVFAAGWPGGQMTFFDWGDAVVGHPFGTLLVTLRVVADVTALPYGDPVLLRLRDAYLEAWTGDHDRATLVEAARLAVRVGGVSRADCYRRALLTATAVQRAEHGDAVPGWLVEQGGPTPLEPSEPQR